MRVKRMASAFYILYMYRLSIFAARPESESKVTNGEFLNPRVLSQMCSQDGFPFYGQLGPGGVEMKVRHRMQAGEA